MTDEVTAVDAAPVDAPVETAPETPSEDTIDYNGDDIPAELRDDVMSDDTAAPAAGDDDFMAKILEQYGDRTVKSKYNGEETEVSIADLINNPASTLAMQKALQAKAETEKAFENIKNGLLSDPLKAIEHLSGGNITPETRDAMLNKLMGSMDNQTRAKLLEQKLIDELEEQKLSPEERENREKLRELEKLKQEQQKQVQAAQIQKLREEYQAEQQSIMKEAADAMTELGLPQNDQYRMTILREAMQTMLYDRRREKATGTPSRLNVKKAIENAKNKVYTGFTDTVKNAPDDTLLDLLGPELTNRVRKALVKKHKAKEKAKLPPVNKTTAATPKKAAPKKNGNKPFTLDDFISDM